MNFPPANSLPPHKWQSQTASSLLMVIMWLYNLEKPNFVTFQDVWWVRSSITTHYNSIHMIIDIDEINRRTPGKHLENTQPSSSWCELSRLFRSRNLCFVLVIQYSYWLLNWFGFVHSKTWDSALRHLRRIFVEDLLTTQIQMYLCHLCCSLKTAHCTKWNLFLKAFQFNMTINFVVAFSSVLHSFKLLRMLF